MMLDRGEERSMGYDDLLCAACSGRVMDGGCPTCRAARESLPSSQLPAEPLLLLALLLTVLLVLSTHL
jgi:hypothetical protein